MKQPVRVWNDLPTSHANCMAIFSPDEQLVLTGVVKGQPQDDTGALVIFDKAKVGHVDAWLRWHA